MQWETEQKLDRLAKGIALPMKVVGTTSLGTRSLLTGVKSNMGTCIKTLMEKYWHLDKDILVAGNKIYSPETCLFVPNRINSLLIRGVKTGPLPLGVSMMHQTKIPLLGLVGAI